MRYSFIAVALLVPTLASAQSIDVFGLTGGAQVWNDESNIGFGVPFGGGVGFKTPQGWGVEAIAERRPIDRSFSSGVRFDSTITSGRARILKYFGDGPAQPYAGGGLGVTRASTTRTEPASVGGRAFSSTSTSGTISGFAGVRIPAGRRLFVRPEFEVARSGELLWIGGNVSIGVGW